MWSHTSPCSARTNRSLTVMCRLGGSLAQPPEQSVPLVWSWWKVTKSMMNYTSGTFLRWMRFLSHSRDISRSFLLFVCFKDDWYIDFLCILSCIWSWHCSSSQALESRVWKHEMSFSKNASKVYEVTLDGSIYIYIYIGIMYALLLEILGSNWGWFCVLACSSVLQANEHYDGLGCEYNQFCLHVEWGFLTGCFKYTLLHMQ